MTRDLDRSCDAAPHTPVDAAALAWARRLAAAVVRDADARDDAVQEAFLAFLEAGRVASPRGFLAARLRGAALHAARAAARRTRRERLAAAPADPADPGLRAADAELLLRIERHLARLDEPYRTAVGLRFRTGLEPVEIAQRLGVPPASVRSQLARGIARLRLELGVAPAARSRADRRAIVPPARIRVLQPLGWFTRGKVLGTIAAAVTLTTTAWLLIGTPPPPPSADPVGRVARPQRAPAFVIDRRAQAGAAPQATASPAGLDAGERIDAFQVIVVTVGGRALAGAHVRVLDPGAAETAAALAEVWTGRDGRARFALPADPLLLARADLVVERPGYADRRLARDATAVEQRLVLYPAATLLGRVVDDDGAAVAGAAVGPRSGDGPLAFRAADGAFGPLDLPADLEQDLVVHAPGRVPELHAVILRGPGVHRRELELSPAMPVDVLVHDEHSDLPLPGVELFASLGDTPEVALPVGRTDGAGRCRVGVPYVRASSAGPSPWILHALQPGYAATRLRIHEHAATLRVPMRRGCRVDGVVTSASAPGEVVGRVSLVLRLEPRERPEDTPGVRFIDSTERRLRTATDARFALDGLAPRTRYRLLAALPGRAETGALEFDTGPPGSDGVDGTGVPVHVRLIEPEGSAAVEGVLTFNGTPGPIPWRYACGARTGEGHADGSGRFRIDGLPAGGITIVARVPGIVEGQATAVLRDGETARLDLDLTAPVSRLAGRVVDADGAPLPHALLTVRGEQYRGQAQSDELGRFEASLALPEGTAVEVVVAGAVFQERSGREDVLLVLPRLQ